MREISDKLSGRRRGRRFLEHEDKFLMINRSADRKYYPEFRASIGGHVESNEMTDPYLACIREIRDETGIVPELITGLSLRYWIVSKKKEVFINHYVYFGACLTSNFTGCDERELK